MSHIDVTPLAGVRATLLGLAAAVLCACTGPASNQARIADCVPGFHNPSGDRARCVPDTPPTASASSASKPRPTRQEFARCRNVPFEVKLVKPVSPMTGEHAFVVQLAYAGTKPCTLRGYPRPTFYSASGSVFPFTYRNGGGQYVTHSSPPYVNLRPGDAAFFEVAKYRCDLRGQTAIRASARIPGGRAPVYPHIQSVASIDYCSEPASLIVYVSPIEPSETQLYDDM